MSNQAAEAAVTATHAQPKVVTYDYSNSVGARSIALSDLVLLTEQQVFVDVPGGDDSLSDDEPAIQAGIAAHHTSSQLHTEDHLKGLHRSPYRSQYKGGFSGAYGLAEEGTQASVTYHGGPGSDVDHYTFGRQTQSTTLDKVFALRNRSGLSSTKDELVEISNLGTTSLQDLARMSVASPSRSSAAPLPLPRTSKLPSSNTSAWAINKARSPAVRNASTTGGSSHGKPAVGAIAAGFLQPHEDYKLRSLPVTHPTVVAHLVDVTKHLAKSASSPVVLVQVHEAAAAARQKAERLHAEREHARRTKEKARRNLDTLRGHLSSDSIHGTVSLGSLHDDDSEKDPLLAVEREDVQERAAKLQAMMGMGKRNTSSQPQLRPFLPSGTTTAPLRKTATLARDTKGSLDNNAYFTRQPFSARIGSPAPSEYIQGSDSGGMGDMAPGSPQGTKSLVSMRLDLDTMQSSSALPMHKQINEPVADTLDAITSRSCEGTDVSERGTAAAEKSTEYSIPDAPLTVQINGVEMTIEEMLAPGVAASALGDLRMRYQRVFRGCDNSTVSEARSCSPSSAHPRRAAPVVGPATANIHVSPSHHRALAGPHLLRSANASLQSTLASTHSASAPGDAPRARMKAFPSPFLGDEPGVDVSAVLDDYYDWRAARVRMQLSKPSAAALSAPKTKLMSRARPT